MSTEIRPAHSPLGASGAERWMNCPGSVALIKELDLPQSDEPDFRSLGTSAHAAANEALVNGLDAWETVGERHGKHVVDVEMADAIQVFLSEVRRCIKPDSKVYYEFGVDAPEFHKDFYGTLDVGIVTGTHMAIRDYKHGEGIAVDVEDNPQMMYYAYGLLRHHPEVETVSLGIVQPRGFHPDGPIRIWDEVDGEPLTADYIRNWAETTLLNAMLATEIDNDLAAGEWCRFCPAKLVCPLMTSLFGAAMQADPKKVVKLTDASIGRSYQYVPAVKSYLKALEEEAYRRLSNGAELPGVKLVPKKANRVFNANVTKVVDGKEVTINIADFMREKYGDEAFTTPELKSPAVLEKIDAEAKKLVHEFAYTPNNGTTVALENDKRPAVKIQTTLEAFPGAAALAAGSVDNAEQAE